MTTKYLDGAGLKYFHDNYVLTASQITTMINNALAQYQQDIVTVVSALPTTGQKEGILYMVPDATDATKFDTYVWEITDDSTTPPTYGWVQQGEGNATVDLSNYYTKTEVDSLLSAKLNAADLVALTTAEIDSLMV